MALPNRQLFSQTNNSERIANQVSFFQIAEVLEIHPHIDIYPADKNFMTVDVKLRDLKHKPEDVTQWGKFTQCNVLQRDIGRLTGSGWLPKIGDIVLIARLQNSDAPIIIGQLYNLAQEPVVTPFDDDFNVSKVEKWDQLERPQAQDDYKNFKEEDYKVPSERDHTTNQPVCHKIYSQNRDTISVYGCDRGYNGNDPHCKDCYRTGIIQTPEVVLIRTNSKETYNQNGSARVEAAPYYEKARRFQIMHHNGSQMTWDEDGNLRWQNDVSKVEKGHVKLDPYGTIEVRSTAENAKDGAYVRVYGPADTVSDSHGKISTQMYDVATGTHVTIYKDGDIIIDAAGDIQITSASNITLEAPEIDIKGRLYTSES